jgi:hypothetical protein
VPLTTSPGRPYTPRLVLRARVALFLLTVGLVSAWGASARAAGSPEDKRACAVASEEAQLRRIHGKLRGARDQLLVCARDVCPPLVKHDCEQWLAEVDGSMPTVVISALDGQGQDVGDVRVKLDDEPFLEKLGGSSVPIDPGEHTLRLQHGDDPPIEEKVIIREGEKNRMVRVQLQPIVALVPTTPMRPAEVPVARTEPASSGRTILGFSLLGAGAVALGLGTYFEITQVNDYASAKSSCPASTCVSQKNTISNDRVFGGVFLGVGGAAAVVGTVVLLTRPSAKDSHPTGLGPPAGRVSVDIGPTHGGAAALVSGSF